MPDFVREVLVCVRDGKQIESQPELGDKQGGRIDVSFPGYTRQVALCSACVRELQEFLGDAGELTYRASTARGMDAFYFLPRVDGSTSTQTP